MKTVLTLVLSFVLFSISAQKTTSLFNGKDLKGWTIYVSDSSVVPETYFYVNNGMIETVGVPIGYLRTKKEYENYHLHVEWRYPEKPVNSGILLHVNGPDLIWAAHYQGQLKNQNAGDFIVQGVGLKATLRDSIYTSTTDDKPLIPKLADSSENPAGQWNSFDIFCEGSTIKLKVNGVLQNVATHCSVTKGGIGLQAEGAKIQFRNLWLKKLK